MELSDEAKRIAERYSRRGDRAALYDPLLPSVYLAVQERHRALVRFLARIAPVRDKSILEIGCGTGTNLLELIALGFQPSNLVGSELLPDRAAEARRRLPGQVTLVEGDACVAAFPDRDFDIVFQSTVFSSILDPGTRTRLANRMWDLVREGGAILSYDFAFDNPKNRDVRGVSVSDLRRLFPYGTVHTMRVTLAPPISRRVTRLHPALYSLFNAIPFLRTHRLCWIVKP